MSGADREAGRTALQHMADHLPGVLYRAAVDRRRTLLFISQGCLDLLGYPVESLLLAAGPAFGDLIHPEDREMVWRVVQFSLGQKVSYRIEYRIRTAEGRERWIWDLGHGRPDAHGEGTVMEGFLADVSERKRLEKDLHRLAAFPEQSPNPVLAADPDGAITYINPAARNLFPEIRRGSNESHPVLENLTSLIARVVRDGEESVVRELEVAGTFYEQRICYVSQSQCIRIDLQDITERRRAQQNVEQYYAEVARARFHAEHQAKELATARNAALEATRMKSDFLANMSHEIRTPMNGILGMTALVLETGLSDEQREYIDLVRQSAHSLLELINDILDFSKIEAGRMVLEQTPFKLGRMLKEAMTPLAMRAEQKGLEIVLRIAAGLPDRLKGDPGRLRQILINLVGNAIKFTESGEIAVGVSIEESTPEKIVLAWTVEDTGIGIPAEKQRLIFHAFTQADGSTHRRYGGTGLGLAISAQLVEMMGGRIWIESEPGQGSQFSFTVILERQEKAGLSPAAGSGSGAARLPASLAGQPVLVVDDNDRARQAVMEMLRTLGMSPLGCGSAREGLTLMHQVHEAGHPFPLVLLDQDLPPARGGHLATLIRSEADLGTTRLILLSPAGRRHHGEECAGVEVVLSKPLIAEDLAEGVRKAVGVTGITSAIVKTTNVKQPASPAPDRLHGPALNILLAEDNPVNRLFAVRLLTSRGHQVKAVEDGRQALAALQQARFDLILMDVQMPEMDGLQATAAIRTAEKSTGEHLAIVALTAHALEEDKERCLAAGMDAYVSKPINIQELLDVMEQLKPAAESLPPSGGKPSPEVRGRSMERDAVQVPASSPPTPAAASRPQDPPGPQAEPPGPLLFDVRAGLKITDGDADLLGELAVLFLDDSPRTMAQLSDGMAAHDLEKVRRAAHRLKGSLATFGASHVAGTAARLEKAGLGDAADSLEGVWRLLQAEMKGLQVELLDLMGGEAST